MAENSHLILLVLNIPFFLPVLSEPNLIFYRQQEPCHTKSDYFFLQGLRFIPAGLYHVLLPTVCDPGNTTAVTHQIPVHCFNNKYIPENFVWYEAPCTLSQKSLCKVEVYANAEENISHIHTVMNIFPSEGIPAYSSAFPYGQDKWTGQAMVLQHILRNPCTGSTYTGRNTIFFHHTIPAHNASVNFVNDISLCDIVDSGLVVAYLPHTSQVYLMFENTPSYVYVTMAVIVVFLSLSVSNSLARITHLIPEDKIVEKWNTQVHLQKLSYLVLLVVLYVPWKG